LYLAEVVAAPLSKRGTAMAQDEKEVLIQALIADQHETQRLLLRMIFVIVLGVWTLAAITTPVVVFLLTRSPLSFSLFSTLAPPVYLWSRFAKYVLMDERLFELEKMRIIVNTKAYNIYTKRNDY
jgi:hypothetical protein